MRDFRWGPRLSEYNLVGAGDWDGDVSSSRPQLPSLHDCFGNRFHKMRKNRFVKIVEKGGRHNVLESVGVGHYIRFVLRRDENDTGKCSEENEKQDISQDQSSIGDRGPESTTKKIQGQREWVRESE